MILNGRDAMNTKRPKPGSPILLWAFLCVLLAGGYLAWTDLACRRAAPPPSEAPVAVDAPADWGVPELVRHLEARGLRLHVVPTHRTTGDLSKGAYLCERERPWDELNALRPLPELAHEWAGVVWVLPRPRVFHEAETWGANGLVAGRLLFFGDPALLRRIAAALAE
jgi:hypothetical protein